MAKNSQVKLFDSAQDQFSVKKGFSLADEEIVGIGGALHYPATYNEAVNYRSAAVRDLNNNMPVNISEITNVINNIPIHMPDGTVTAPGLPFGNDLDTGFYRIAANKLGIAANGAFVAHFADSDITLGKHVLFSVDGTFNIGEAADHRPNNIYAYGDIDVGNFVVFLAGNAAGNTVSLIHYNNTGNNRSAEFPIYSGDTVVLAADNGDVVKGGTFYYATDGAAPNPVVTILPPNTSSTKKFLSMTGVAGEGAPPVWDDIASSNLPAAMARAQYVATATGTVTNTGTETTLIGSGVGTLTLTAGQLIAGSTLKIEASGVYSVRAVPGTLNIRVKFGSTVLAATGDQVPGLTVTNRRWVVNCMITCRSVGGSGTVFTQGDFTHMETAAGIGAPTSWEMLNTTTNTVDTTGTLAINLTADWDAGATAADSISCTNFTVTVMD